MQLKSPLLVLSSAFRRSGFRLGLVHHPYPVVRFDMLREYRPFSCLAAMAKDSGLEEILMMYRRQDNLPDVILAKGSVVTFRSKDKGAIVNAANEVCLGGGGVDGAISAAGGPELYYARQRLPFIRDAGDSKQKTPSPTESHQSADEKDPNVATTSTNEVETPVQSTPDDDDDNNDDGSDKRIRCRTGEAVITGPGRFGKLQVPFVIHAVGPNFWGFPDRELAYEKMTSAYQSSLDLAEKYKIEEIAFCLLSAGIYRGNEKMQNVIGSGLQAVAAWRPKGQLAFKTDSTIKDSSIENQNEMNLQQNASIKKIYVCAFTERECKMLVAGAKQLFAKDPTIKAECFMI
jgi:O-acetyl-ADP-ribose deacetylase (regulator of RNase III)